MNFFLNIISKIIVATSLENIPLFFGLLLIYPFNVISISVIIYLAVLPISFFHYQKFKKQNEDKNFNEEDEDLEDVL